MEKNKLYRLSPEDRVLSGDIFNCGCRITKYTFSSSPGYTAGYLYKEHKTHQGASVFRNSETKDKSLDELFAEAY